MIVFAILFFQGTTLALGNGSTFVSGILTTATGYLTIAAQAGTSSVLASKLITDAESLGENAYKLLQYVAGADATQIPHQVVAPFQRWVKQLKINNTIFFRAEHVSNYELARFDFGPYAANINSPSANLTAASAAIAWPVIRVTMPSQAMGMLPHFAVVGHELGHAIDAEIKPDFAAHVAAATDCSTKIEGRLKALGHAYGPKERLLTQEVVGLWIGELKADAVGHFISGPAFFFALFGFIELSGRSYGIGKTHPPSELRRTLLMARLSANQPSFVDVFRDATGLLIDEAVNSPNLPACPPPDQLFAELRKSYGDPLAAICVEVIAYIGGIASDIFSTTLAYLEKECPEMIYKPDQLKLDLERHLDLLCQLVPPFEYRDEQNAARATSLASILNVGWAALLTRLDTIPAPSDPNKDQVATKMERLHELLLKAVELSEARQVWEEHR